MTIYDRFSEAVSKSDINVKLSMIDMIMESVESKLQAWRGNLDLFATVVDRLTPSGKE